MTRPIRQLTAVIEQTAKLDFRPTKEGGKLRKQKDEIGNMATKIHIMRKKLREMMGDLQQTQQVLESNAEDLNHLMKQNSAYAEDNSAATQELAAGMEETSANAAHIVENVGIMRESSDNIQRLAEDGEKNSGQIQERAGEMERISTESRHKTDQAEKNDFLKAKIRPVLTKGVLHFQAGCQAVVHTLFSHDVCSNYGRRSAFA